MRNVYAHPAWNYYWTRPPKRIWREDAGQLSNHMLFTMMMYTAPWRELPRRG